MKRKFVRIIGIILGVYLLICVGVFWFQERLIFIPAREQIEAPPELGIESVFFDTDDGVKLHAWYMDIGAPKTVLFFHGNAGNASFRVKQFEYFRELGVNGMVLDYRGYGLSEGRIRSEDRLLSDGSRAYKYLVEEEDIATEDIIVWGRSLGGAVAVHVAQNQDLDGVILESTFFSMRSMAGRLYPFLPVDLFLRYPLRSDEKIRNVISPILLIHSLDDEIVPIEEGRRLFEEAPEPKEFVEIGGSHNDGIYEFEEVYLESVRAFVKENNL